MQDDKKDKPSENKFWDFSVEVIPRSQFGSNAPRTSSPRSGYSVTDITSDQPSRQPGEYADSKIPPQQYTVSDSGVKKLLYSYEPSNPLIQSVEVYTDKLFDSIYKKNSLFLRERAALIDKVGTEAPYVPYFSITPRYSQMTKQQLNYYLWWRENMRHGNCMKTDTAYILLYVHELVASENDDPKDVLATLCGLLDAVGRNCAQSSYIGLCSIIVDYCLLHHVVPSDECPKNRLSTLLTFGMLPELFVDISERNSRSLHEKILITASSYNYKKSKYYAENSETYEKHMLGAIGSIFADERAYGALTSFTNSAYGEILTSRRPYYNISGMVCLGARIKIRYYPLSLMKSAITDGMRYMENKLREHLGIKSKLNIMTVNPDIKAAIDEYARIHCPPMARERISRAAEAREEESYAHLYDTPHTPLSLEKAREIEKSSWDTTKILVEAFENGSGGQPQDNSHETHSPMSIQPHESSSVSCAENITTHVPDNFSVPSADIPSESVSLASALAEYAEFLELCKSGQMAAQHDAARRMGMPADSIADEINAIAVDITGDILLIDTDGGYAIIDEYKNLV